MRIVDNEDTALCFKIVTCGSAASAIDLETFAVELAVLSVGACIVTTRHFTRRDEGMNDIADATNPSDVHCVAPRTKELAR